MGYPGILSRAEFATGLITRSIKINGNYLLVDECNLNQSQNIDTTDAYLQAGPGSAIGFFDAKKITGNLSFPIRINHLGEIDEAAIEILNHAQNPVSGLVMDTNHVLVHEELTAEDHATDNNKLIKLDSMVISQLTLSCSNNDVLKASVTFEGMIDDYSNSDYTVPDENNLLGRALTWADCNAFRDESALRTVTSFSVTINNTIETPIFLLPYFAPGDTEQTVRNDQIGFLGVRSVKWGGNITELLRSGADLDTFIHGGWMINENLTFEMGPMSAIFKNPLFKIAQLPLTPSVLTRTTEWSSLMKPTLPLSPDGLFTFN
jgi:hypothetical protein